MLRVILQLLAIAITQVKTQGRSIPANVTQKKFGSINVRDHIAEDLNTLFGSKVTDKKLFQVNNEAAQITSSNAFSVMEFMSGCKVINRGYRESKADHLVAVCNEDQVYELFVDLTVTGKPQIKSFVRLATLNGTCHEVIWFDYANVYVVMCETKPVSSKETGWAYFYTVARGKENLNKTFKDRTGLIKSAGFNFTEKRRIQQTEFPKGRYFQNEQQVLIYDEPYIDQNDRVAAKYNLFFFLLDINVGGTFSSPKGMTFFLLRDKVADGKLDEMRNFKKMVTFNEIDGSLVMAGYFYGAEDMLIKTVACDLNTQAVEKDSVTLALCRNLPTKQTIQIGHIQFWKKKTPEVNHKVSMYQRSSTMLTFCIFDLKDKNPDFTRNCSSVVSRAVIVPDLSLGYFDDCGGDSCQVIYMNRAHSLFIGIDIFDYNLLAQKSNTTKPGGVPMPKWPKERYKARAYTGRVLSERFYTTESKYIMGYDASRSEEFILNAGMLPPGKQFFVTLKKVQGDSIGFVNVTGYRVQRMIFQIRTVKPMPYFKGSLKYDYYIPLGRSYFQGNGIEFGLSANNDVRSLSHIHYQSPGEIFIGNRPVNLKQFLIGKGTHTAVDSNNQFYLLNCRKALVTHKIALNCTQIVPNGVMPILKTGEKVLNHFSLETCHIVVTSEGRVLVYERMKNKILDLATQREAGGILDVSFHLYQQYVYIASISGDKKNIYVQGINVYNIEGNRLSTVMHLIEYGPNDKEANQNGPGEFCPIQVEFSFSQTPNLLILNACKDNTDKRIILYTLADNNNLVFYSNSFIKKPELDTPTLKICPAQNLNFIAALNTSYAFGIGLNYKGGTSAYTNFIGSHNMIEDLGLNELNIVLIHEMLCFGDRALGLIMRNDRGQIKVATYFKNKFTDAPDRLHSVHTIQKGVFQYASGSISHDGLIFYNIKLAHNNFTELYVVDLEGPNIYLKSMRRTIAYETQITTGNGFENRNFNAVVQFMILKSKGSISSRTRNFKINTTKYNLEEICFFNGPLFDMQVQATAAKFTSRLSSPARWSPQPIENTDAVYFEEIQSVGDKIFALSQTSSASYTKVMVANPDGSNQNFLPMYQVCHGLTMEPDRRYSQVDAKGVIHLKRFIGLSNCYNRGIPYVSLVIIDTLAANPKDMITVVRSDNTWSYLARNMDIAYFGKNFTGTPSVAGGLQASSNSGSGPSSSGKKAAPEEGDQDFIVVARHLENRTAMFKWVSASGTTGTNVTTFNNFSQIENVQKIQLVDPAVNSDILFVLYSSPGDSDISLKIIRKVTRTIESSDRLIIDRTDGTSLADFDCKYLNRIQQVLNPIYDKVVCAFATHGPYYYKVTYDRNQYAGLIFRERQQFEKYADSTPVKITFNDKFIVVLARSASRDVPMLLVYRDQDKLGSRYLYGGVNLDRKLTEFVLEDLHISITEDDLVLISTNKEGQLITKVQVSDMTVNVTDVNGLDDFTNNFIALNSDSDLPHNTIPAKYVFVWLSDQFREERRLGGSLFEWILLLVFILCVLILALFIKRDILRTKKAIIDSGVQLELDQVNQTRNEDLDESVRRRLNDTFAPSDDMDQIL